MLMNINKPLRSADAEEPGNGATQLTAQNAAMEKSRYQLLQDFLRLQVVVIFCGVMFAVFGLYLASLLGILPESFKAGGVEANFGKRTRSVINPGIDSLKQAMNNALLQMTARYDSAIQVLDSNVRALSNSEAIPVDGATSRRTAVAQMAKAPIFSQAANVQLLNAFAPFSQKSTQGTSDSSLLSNKTGYIYVGDYDGEERRWLRVFLSDPAKNMQPYGEPPANLTANREYAVSGNMSLRADAPKNDDNYFSGVGRLSVLPKNTRVRLLEAAKRYSRPHRDQYWCKVVVLN